jgi:hypothetical protein
LLLLVGGAVFELVTGVMNIQYYYAWPFPFYQAHYYGAWVFIAAFVVHVAFRLGRLVTALRSRSLVRELRTPLSATRRSPLILITWSHWTRRRRPSPGPVRWARSRSAR